jgi:hypothetical protein
MPGDRHEVPLLLLQERPELLTELLALTGSKRLTNLSVVNTAVRFADVAGINPDLVFRSKEIPWLVLELQHAVDPDKRRIWPLVVGSARSIATSHLNSRPFMPIHRLVSNVEHARRCARLR